MPKEFRFEGTEVRVSKIGNKVILEPMESGAMPWALIDETGDSPFMPDGRERQRRASGRPTSMKKTRRIN